MLSRSMLDSRFPYDKIVYDFFQRSKHFPFYKDVFYLDLCSIAPDKLKQISNCTEKKAVIVSHDVLYFDPQSKIAKQYIQFKDLLLQYKIFDCDFYITDHSNDSLSSIDYLNTNSYGWKFNHFALPIPWITHKINFNDERVGEFNVQEVKTKFSHVNYTHRMHRQLFSKFLIQHNLVEDNLIAINPDRITARHHEKNTIKKTILIENESRDGWFYSQKFLNLWRDVELVYNKHILIDDNADLTYQDFLKHSCLNIVSETAFDYPGCNHSEKILQPMLSMRPFVIISSAHSLQFLRSKGFETFGNIIDESYDEIEDPNHRLEKVMSLVLELNKLTLPEMKQLLIDTKPKLEHNFRHLKKLYKHFTNNKF